ncbi:PRC-barrel domain-containing protein [Aurantiacibacter sp. MUD11]|uniref:PRC-barrel domain-containing protein n=1 Tax=Aurantiacibacter sp. MUD11 TaxID=3003265 RepID=UPI0022AACE30|nr:PRC-barrel domain-containing protein [Aurantiacibacter sp. MUD11]WAT17274.1 PRC-barrel domain-containing protein [Aurantiacibacter sp. MUD11]
MTQTSTLRTRTEFSDAELNRRAEFDRSRPVERDEADNLISSSKVEGTKVFSTDGEEIGKIDHLMIGKRSGRVEYSVMSFSGFLGMGESHFPVPWDALDYDVTKDGYVVNIDKSQLREAPSYAPSETPTFTDNFGRQVFSYYGVMY